MSRLFLCLSLIAITLTSGQEAAAATDTEPDRGQMLREAQARTAAVIATDDVHALERHAVEIHNSFRNGAMEADALRLFYARFGEVDPRLHDLATRWQDAYPDSPHAMMALAWQRWSAGWLARGEAPALDVPLPAMQLFETNVQGAIRAAERALDLDPDHIPASDLLIHAEVLTPSSGWQRLGGGLGKVDLLWLTMSRHPNAGTLYRALGRAQPGWGGGGLDEASKLCGRYAPLVGDVWGEEPVRACILWYLIGHDLRAFTYEHLAWFEALDPEVAQLQGLRSEIILRLGLADPDYAMEVHDLLVEADPPGLSQLRHYEAAFADRGLAPSLMERFLPAIMDEARAALARNPQSVDALGVLQYRPNGVADYEAYRASGLVSDAERLDAAWRRLELTPLSSNAWAAYRRALTEHHGTEALQRLADQNVVIYTNHSPRLLAGRAALALMDLSVVRETWRSLPVGGQPLPEADQMAADFCPAIRLARVAHAACEYRPYEMECGSLADMITLLPDTIAEAKELGICQGERLSDVSRLGWKAIPFRDGGVNWPRRPEDIPAAAARVPEIERIPGL